MQSGKYRSPGNCQTQTCPLDCQTEKHGSSLREHISTTLESSVGWLSCCCSQLLPLCYNTTNS
ncbi:unnamed protein product [Staurois parvus]|uniref:Uncharacterized protein n=1 Tax=Staurois parvus TaxID=386267 RepID=A0ABN9FD52_9NEOB|nr:unnamed protein product [Staurois parvus]